MISKSSSLLWSSVTLGSLVNILFLFYGMQSLKKGPHEIHRFHRKRKKKKKKEKRNETVRLDSHTVTKSPDEKRINRYMEI